MDERQSFGGIKKVNEKCSETAFIHALKIKLNFMKIVGGKY